MIYKAGAGKQNKNICYTEVHKFLHCPSKLFKSYLKRKCHSLEELRTDVRSLRRDSII